MRIIGREEVGAAAAADGGGRIDCSSTSPQDLCQALYHGRRQIYLRRSMRRSVFVCCVCE